MLHTTLPLCAVVCALLLASAQASSPPTSSKSLPLLAWSSHEGGNSGEGISIGYQQAPVAQQLEGLLSGPAQTSVVFVGSQLTTAALRSQSQQLEELLTRARSSVVLPYAQQGEDEEVAQSLSRSRDVQAIGCEQQLATSEGVAEELQRVLAAAAAPAAEGGERKSTVLLVCAPRVPTSADAAAAELQLLGAVQAVLDKQGSSSQVVYVGSPATESTPSRRSTLTSRTGFGPYKECGQLCQTQVKWLEGILAFLFMALAAGAGMTCLTMLDTPSRFEKAKEASGN